MFAQDPMPPSGWAPVVFNVASHTDHRITSAHDAIYPVLIEFVAGTPKDPAALLIEGCGPGIYRVVDPRLGSLVSEEVIVPVATDLVKIPLTPILHVMEAGKELHLIVEEVKKVLARPKLALAS